MQRLLFIAYEFPPINSGGSHRPGKFVKALLEKGYAIEVICCAPVSFDDQKKIDNTLSFVHEHLTIHTVSPRDYTTKDRFFETYYFNIADRTWSRWKNGVLDTLKMLKDDYDAIYVTVPPFSMTYVLPHLKRMFKAPIMLDFRDAWALWNVFPYVTKLHYYLTKRREAQALALADKIIVTSEQTGQDFCGLHGEQFRKKMAIITNGYSGEPQPFDPLTQQEKYKIGYVGSFYYDPSGRNMALKPWHKKKPHQWFQYLPRFEDWLYRSPYFVFKALKELRKKDPNLYLKLELHIAGHQPSWLEAMIEESGISDIITVHGPLPHDQALRLQAESDLLLLTSAKIPEAKDYSIAGKTFEYLKIGKPILAFVCEGAQKKLLEETGQTLIVNPDNSCEAANQIKKYLNGNSVLSSVPEKVRMHRSTEKADLLIKEIVSLTR